MEDIETLAHDASLIDELSPLNLSCPNITTNLSACNWTLNALDTEYVYDYDTSLATVLPFCSVLFYHVFFILSFLSWFCLFCCLFNFYFLQLVGVLFVTGSCHSVYVLVLVVFSFSFDILNVCNSFCVRSTVFLVLVLVLLHMLMMTVLIMYH